MGKNIVNIAVAADTGTRNIVNAEVNSVIRVHGSATLTEAMVIAKDAEVGSPVTLNFLWEADVTTGAYSVTICGRTITKAEALQNFMLTVTWDGSAYDYYMTISETEASEEKSVLLTYDFAVDGGTAGTIALTGAPEIPDNAVVWVESYDVITTCTSGTDAATIAVQLPTDGVLTTAIAISAGSNPWDAGVFTGVSGGLATPLPKKCTAARVPSLLVAGGENLTAGKIVFQLKYWVSV